MENSENPVIRLTFKFSLEIIRYTEQLENMKKYLVSRQLLASGTSIGANVMEAQSPQSKRDFNHKMKIAYKELLETDYWLQLCQKSEGYPNTEKLLKDLHEIKKVLSKIISTSTKNINKQKINTTYSPKIT